MARPIKVGRDGTFGFDEVRRALNGPRVAKGLRKHLKRGLNVVGEMFITAATDVIQSEKPFAENSPVTIALKSSSTPLVSSGDRILDALAFKVVRFTKIRMGVQSEKLGSGRFLAEVLHNGATIPVTPAMRAAVFAKLRDRLGDAAFKDFAANLLAGPAKQFWTIPARPFLRKVFDDLAWRRKITQVLVLAVRRGLEEGV